MSEHIELQSFNADSTNDSDIEEYHEIDQDACLGTSHLAAHRAVCSDNNIKGYDFFTQNNVKIEGKVIEKRKKPKKENISNIIDLISSELASVEVPLIKNVIRKVENIGNQQNSCLSPVSNIRNVFKESHSLRACSSNRYRNNIYKVNISPIFPRVIENVATRADGILVQYVDPTMFKDFIETNESKESKEASQFLDIAVKNLRFKHHHSFSLEKFLCLKLVDVYNEYTLKQKFIKDILRDVRVNRETRNNLKESLLKVRPKNKDDLRFDQTIRKYTEKLIQLKEKYIEALKQKDELIHNMMALWADIEMVRERSGCITTSYVLDVTTRTMDDKKFEDEWDKVFNTEFTDLVSKIEYEYITKYLEYKEMKNGQNNELLQTQKFIKPKLEIHEDSLKEQVEDLVNDIVTKGSINVILKSDDNILSKIGKHRKNNLIHKYRFQIMVDETFVCDSENDTFANNINDEVEFNESFSIQILPHNRILMIVLFEDSEQVSFIKKDLVNIRKNYQNTDFIAEQFVYSNIVEPTMNCIGSGYNIKEIMKINKVKLKSKNLFEGNMYTTCEISFKIGWNHKHKDNHCENIKSSMEIERCLKRMLHGIDKPNVATLLDILTQMYGRDVENDDIVLDMLKKLCKPTMKNEKDLFPLPDKNSHEFIRFKLLHLRNAGRFTNVENKIVPLHGSQISTDQLKCLQQSDEKDFDIEYINSKYLETDPIELQRFIGAKYVQKLNKNMLRNLNEHLLKKTHKDVVRDFKDLSLRSFFSNKTSLTSLATMSGATKQQLLLESLGTEQEIQVTVLKAFNLLDRKEDIITEDDDDADRIAGYKVRSLRPMVRVSYRGECAQTAAAVGCHPTWNQTIKIKAKPEPLSSLYVNVYDVYKSIVREGHSGDGRGTVHYRYHHKWLGTLQIPLYSVLSMGVLRGTFKLSSPPLLFGYESPTETPETHSLIPGVTQLLKKNMSFISLQITSPLSHLGGPQGYNQPVPSGPDDDYLIKHLNNFVTEYVNAFPLRNISLTFIDSSGKNKCVTQFLQPIPLPDYDFFPKNPKKIGSALSKSSGFSGSSCKSNVGSRFDVDLEKGSSPTINEEESIYSAREGSWRGVESQLTKLVDAAARYVALIPTYHPVETHAVTLSGLELLRVVHGSPLDHSLLLASYFLYLGLRCWVAVGRGLPRARCSGVLTARHLRSRRIVLTTDQLFKKGLFNKSDGYLWNVHDASTGEHYELRDVSCPLKTVDFVFNNENIWVNVQSSQDCENMSFDFEKSSDWNAVFDRKVFVMKQPVVTDAALYSAPGDAARLRLALESAIRGKLHKWRPRVKTVWNRYCSGLLREQLSAWEYWSFNPGEPRPGLGHKMKQMMATYRMFGFPLNMSYMNTKTVISAVKSTRLHVYDDPNAEFALAVEVYTYPNNVVSLWVFLACITRILSD